MAKYERVNDIKELIENDFVYTKSSSTAKITFNDASLVILGPNSKIKIYKSIINKKLRFSK